MEPEPIKEYKFLGNGCKVYQNRIEISFGKGLFGKTESILIKNISSVEKPRGLNRIDIKTNDGKKHSISVTPKTEDTEELRNIILNLI